MSNGLLSMKIYSSLLNSRIGDDEDDICSSKTHLSFSIESDSKRNFKVNNQTKSPEQWKSDSCAPRLSWALESSGGLMRFSSQYQHCSAEREHLVSEHFLNISWLNVSVCLFVRKLSVILYYLLWEEEAWQEIWDIWSSTERHTQFKLRIRHVI